MADLALPGLELPSPVAVVKRDASPLERVLCPWCGLGLGRIRTDQHRAGDLAGLLKATAGHRHLCQEAHS